MRLIGHVILGLVTSALHGAKSLNWVPFAFIFLKDTALFCWQQHQRKMENKTDISITWKEFKAFLCQSLGESEAFIDIIWSTIWKDSQH